jgi:hypothetical protein
VIPIKTFREHLINNTNETYTDKIMEVVGETPAVNAKLVNGIMGIATPDTIYIDVEGIMERHNDETALSFVMSSWNGLDLKKSMQIILQKTRLKKYLI